MQACFLTRGGLYVLSEQGAAGGSPPAVSAVSLNLHPSRSAAGPACMQACFLVRGDLYVLSAQGAASFRHLLCLLCHSTRTRSGLQQALRACRPVS